MCFVNYFEFGTEIAQAFSVEGIGFNKVGLCQGCSSSLWWRDFQSWVTSHLGEGLTGPVVRVLCCHGDV